MNNRTKSFIYAAVIGLIIVAIFLGFLSSLANPISWILIAVLIMIPMLYKRKGQDNQVQWREEYSVGITHIDNDHKKLISLLNQFSMAYDYAMSETFEKEALEELVSYTKYHFEREEKLMSENDYPDFEAHKAQHEQMIAQVEEFVQLYNEKGHDALNEIVEFLTGWLINHINGTDKQYSEHLHERGVY
ncbi:bacteriohemerythrin [Litorilituus sediminis]|uniref:Hemerythrin n=1 Tax=Litorilituus sediminis TaxID=718192 RepID=A0A4P6P315_9GAMM|nr:bacteriohemerythrin [Litorilituus sediminis]QBG35663.1 hemerythrin [Litorilituus sediminis]